jgi:hypothetical protein
MPVNSVHADYLERLPQWQRARDVLSGEDRVKAAGTLYLPRLDSQSDEEYAAYTMRASFFNATARTAEGYVGQIFRKTPVVKLPASGPMAAPMTAFVADVDMQGRTLLGYARDIVGEVVSLGRAGTLVDWDDGEGRAYLAAYAAESILNWREERHGGRNLLTLVVLSEFGHSEAAGDDEFSSKQVEQLRVLRLSPDQSGAMEYSVEIWRQVKQKRGEPVWTLMERFVPRRAGKALALIPFVFHGPTHARAACEKLPLGDVIVLNLDHYRLDADYKHGVHFTALPTPWASGFDKESILKIGAQSAWQADQPGATAGFLEFTGKGLSTFENAMSRDEGLMAVLGARLLEQQKMVGESAQAIALRHAGHDSVLATLALSVSGSLTVALRWLVWWHGLAESPLALGEDDALLALNTDFSTSSLGAREIREIVLAWEAGAISHDTLLDVFRRGEVLPDGRSNEEEKASAKPAAGAVLGVSGSGASDGPGGGDGGEGAE